MKWIRSFFQTGDKRSLLLKKNIVLSFLFRMFSMLVSLLLVPISINFLSAETYGLWLTISSIISWMVFFDFGFAHGFRNSFAKAVANEDYVLAKKYVSTAYFAISCIFLVLMALTSFINYHINWSEVLNLPVELNEELNRVFQIMIIFFCLKNITDVFLTMMTAYQQPAVSVGITALGDMCVLIAVCTIAYCSELNLSILAFVMYFVPCSVTLLTSIVIFNKKDYKKFTPSIKFIEISLIKDIVGIGTQFFIIMMSMLFIFQFTNIIITRELGAEFVTIYNVTYKIFSVMIIAITIFLNPVWSAFTDAYTKKDYDWMKKCMKRIEKMGMLTIPVIVVLLLLSEFIFDIWLGDKVETDFRLTVCMAIYAICQIISQIYMYPLNGMGKVRIQLIVYLFFAVVAIPGIIYFTRLWGIVGTMIVPTLTFFVQSIVNKVQVMKIINKRATGMWNK